MLHKSLGRILSRIIRKKTKPAQHAVVMTTHNESLLQIQTSLQSIKKHEPDFPVTVISDGQERPDIETLTKNLGYNYLQGEPLKRLDKGALWWKRTLTEGLKHNTDFILKMDPDALFVRPFREGPRGDYYGSLQTINNIAGTQGGCQGISRKFAEDIIVSELTEDPLMSDPTTWFSKDKVGQILKENYLSTDCTLAYIAHKLKVKPVEWGEIGSSWKIAPSNKNLRYAVTHPHKLD